MAAGLCSSRHWLTRVVLAYLAVAVGCEQPAERQPTDAKPASQGWQDQELPPFEGTLGGPDGEAGGGHSALPNEGLRIEVSPSVVCPGECASVRVAAANASSHTYQWQPELPGTAGPHRVCPEVTTRIEVVVKDSSQEFGAPDRRAMATVTVSGDCDGGFGPDASGHLNVGPDAESRGQPLDAGTPDRGGAFHGDASDAGAGPDAGPSEEAPDMVAIGAGMDHTCVVLSDGAVKCWGADSYGQLGIEERGHRGDEPGEMGDALPRVQLGTGLRVRAVALGRWASCALLEDGRVKCWGLAACDSTGQSLGPLGLEPGTMGDALPFIPLPEGSRARAVSLYERTGCAVLRSGGVYCWASRQATGSFENRGADPERSVEAFELGDTFECALFEDGRVQCAGSNHFGQLGQNDQLDRTWADIAEDIDLGADADVASLALGSLHVCALLRGGRIKCWGDNEYGQLGLGDTNHRGDEPGEMGDALPAVALGAGRHALAIAAGGHTSCAILDDETLKCWGGGWGIQFGLGSGIHGDGPFEMGDALPAINLGTGRRVKAVALGGAHTCAVLDNRDVKCWGDGFLGVLGQGNSERLGDQLWEMGDALQPVDLGATLLQ